MGAMVGDKVKLITSEETDLEMTVGGIFQSGFYEYDLNMVLIPLQTAQYITYSDETVGRLSVRLDNPYDAQELIYDVARKLPTDLYIGTWGEQNSIFTYSYSCRFLNLDNVKYSCQRKNKRYRNYESYGLL